MEDWNEAAEKMKQVKEKIANLQKLQAEREQREGMCVPFWGFGILDIGGDLCFLGFGALMVRHGYVLPVILEHLLRCDGMVASWICTTLPPKTPYLE
jgi:hypothetical protein